MGSDASEICRLPALMDTKAVSMTYSAISTASVVSLLVFDIKIPSFPGPSAGKRFDRA